MTTNRSIKVKNYWDLIAGFTCLFAGIIIYFVLIPLTIEQRASIAANIFFTDARFFPQLCGCLMIFLSIGAILESLTYGEKAGADMKVTRIDMQSVKETAFSCGTLLIAMCAYVYLLTVLGFVISSALLVGVSLWLFEYRHPSTFITIVLATTLGIYYVWVKLLYVIFPAPVFPFPLV